MNVSKKLTHVARTHERGVCVKSYLEVGLMDVSLVQREAGEGGAGARVPGTTRVELALNTRKQPLRLLLSTRQCCGSGIPDSRSKHV
jgi:hypothetical protein